MRFNLNTIRNRPGRRLRGAGTRRGASIVEAALLLPLVMLLLMGILEYSRYVMMRQVLTNAAREGAHYALSHSEPVTILGVTYGNATSDVVAAVNKAMGGQQLVGQTVQVYASDTVGNNIGVWNDAGAGETVCVKITGNFKMVVPSLLYLPASLPVTATSVMRSEGN